MVQKQIKTINFIQKTKPALYGYHGIFEWQWPVSAFGHRIDCRLFLQPKKEPLAYLVLSHPVMLKRSLLAGLTSCSIIWLSKITTRPG